MSVLGNLVNATNASSRKVRQSDGETLTSPLSYSNIIAGISSVFPSVNSNNDGLLSVPGSAQTATVLNTFHNTGSGRGYNGVTCG